jgi:outer membrane protein OmpA-like peptidoglycan-associated protein
MLRRLKPVQRLAPVIVTFLAASIGACSGAAAQPVPARLLIVAGASANEAPPVLTNSVTAMLHDAIASDRGRLDVVVAGPSGPVPQRSIDLVLRRGSRVEHDGDRRAQLSTQLLGEIGRTLARLSGTSGQIDTLGLLGYVSRQPGEVTAVVMSSGLQSEGPLAIDAIGWDRVGSRSVLDAVAAQQLVPDLHGKTIVFVGLGDVAGAQPALPDSLRMRLVGLWLGLCRAAGGVCSVDDEPMPPATPTSTVPAPVVDVPALPALILPTTNAPVVLPSAALFEPDSAILLPGAAAALTTFARGLPAGARIALDGRTATVPPADQARHFSRARAQACVDVLVAAGVPSDHITTRGLGYDEPLVPDVDAQGHLIPDAASRNRSVTVTVTNGGPL